jgi:tetratricopeptide (TPR) repeat protein
MKENVRMLMRIISAFGMVIVMLNSRSMDNDLALYLGWSGSGFTLSFYVALMSILLLIPVFLKIKLKLWIDWIPITISLLLAIIGFYDTSKTELAYYHPFDDWFIVYHDSFIGSIAIQSIGFIIAMFFLALYQEKDDKGNATVSDTVLASSNEAVYYNNRAAAYNKKRDYDHAIVDCTEAIRLREISNNLSASPYRHRAYAYMQKGDFIQARADVNMALQINQNYQNAKDLDEELKQHGY